MRKISTIDLSYVVTVKSMVEILQNFVAFSEYMNFHISLVIFEFGFFTINSKGVKNFNTFFMSLVY